MAVLPLFFQAQNLTFKARQANEQSFSENPNKATGSD